jgi:predicted AlkP superfamily phosphohydrolase/phosphomutase
MLSGLGVLDLKGSVGRYTLYTGSNVPVDPDMKGDVILISSDSEKIKAILPGPDNSKVPVEINIVEQYSKATITINGKSYTAKQGKWSDWIQLRFSLGPLRRVSGIFRLYLASTSPQLKLYVSPIQVDPQKPAYPISYPDEYATELAKDIGSYSTLGIPEDTNGLRDDCFDDEAFLSQCNDLMAEREKMLWHELGRFEEGLLAFVFDTTDRIQHIYWSTRDPEHPAHDGAHAKKYRSIIGSYYKRMDRILERVLESVDQQTVIFVVSDHGFTSFRRAVHINSWLTQNGLMVLKRPAQDTQGDPLFKNVVWERTMAYAVGFSSIYLNLRGREGKGIVNPGRDAEQLKTKITSVLNGLRDPKTGGPVIRNAYSREDIYNGPYANDGPDLVVGFEPHYRASWQTAIGGVPPRIIEDNAKKWSGDHICDAQCIPGVFLVNRKTSVLYPSIVDIAPTILTCFQIPQPKSMEGISLLD